MPNKATLAKIAGWGQFVVEVLNEVIQTNGGMIPNTRAAWLRVLASLALAGGIHHASNTSAERPNG